MSSKKARLEVTFPVDSMDSKSRTNFETNLEVLCEKYDWSFIGSGCDIGLKRIRDISFEKK